MNRWILALLICVALYVGIVLVRELIAAVEHPAPQSAYKPVAPSPVTTATSSSRSRPATSSLVATRAVVRVRQIKDSRGNTVVEFSLVFAGGPPPSMTVRPTLEVRDAAGSVVHSGKFEFG